MGQQGSGKSTLSLWLSNSSEDLRKRRMTQGFEEFQPGNDSCSWIPDGEPIRVIDTPPLPATMHEDPHAWVQSHWLLADETFPHIKNIDSFVLVLDGKNARHSTQYFLSFKHYFSKMVRDYGDLIGRLMVVVTRVDRKFVNETSPPGDGSVSFTDVGRLMRLELDGSQVCEVNFKDLRELQGKSRMNYVEQNQLSDTHNVLQLKKIVNHAMRFTQVQFYPPRRLTISLRHGDEEAKAIFIGAHSILKETLRAYCDKHSR